MFAMGVAAKAWILSIQWIADCLKSAEILPEVNYLVLLLTGQAKF
jgi:hypothetical protein